MSPDIQSSSANNLVTSVDNNGTPNVPRVVLSRTYDALSRTTSESATVAGMNDFLNNYSYDQLNRLTRVTHTQQTGGNSVAAKRVDLAYNADGQYTSLNRYADTTGTNLVATSTYVHLPGEPAGVGPRRAGILNLYLRTSTDIRHCDFAVVFGSPFPICSRR